LRLIPVPWFTGRGPVPGPRKRARNRLVGPVAVWSGNFAGGRPDGPGRRHSAMGLMNSQKAPQRGSAIAGMAKQKPRYPRSRALSSLFTLPTKEKSSGNETATFVTLPRGGRGWLLGPAGGEGGRSGGRLRRGAGPPVAQFFAGAMFLSGILAIRVRPG
jgi:hypothetical protein